MLRVATRMILIPQVSRGLIGMFLAPKSGWTWDAVLTDPAFLPPPGISSTNLTQQLLSFGGTSNKE